MIDRLRGRDSWTDLLHVLSLFVGFIVADRLLIRLGSISPDGLAAPLLLFQAVTENVVPLALLALLALGAAVVASRRGSPFLCRWDALEQGAVLRAVGVATILWLMWRGAAYNYNYVLDVWHTGDRLLVVGFGLAAIARPVFLLPFVAQLRVVNGQFLFPLGSAFGLVSDEFLMLVATMLGVAYLLHAFTGRRQSSQVILLWGTVVAAYMFEPGRNKLMMGWLGADDVSFLAFNSYTAGWLGQGTGEYARRLGALVAAAGWPVKLGTLLVELGAIAAVAHPRVLRLWLPMAAGFHALTFAMTGFFFFDWIAFELALVFILTAPGLGGWVKQNATPARALLGILIVAMGARFYRAPGLAWLDAPVGYGYEVEGVGRSGQAYHVPLSAFAPFEQDMMFMQASFSPIPRAVGGYGATSSPDRIAMLGALDAVEELAGAEATLGARPTYPDTKAELLISSFFRYASRDGAGRGHLFNAPSRFWSGRDEPSFRFDEPLDSLRITLVASLTRDGVQTFRRTPVLAIGRGVDGGAVLQRLAVPPTPDGR